jgi:hypothetical protein
MIKFDSATATQCGAEYQAYRAASASGVDEDARAVQRTR